MSEAMARIQRVINEVRGVKAQYGISEWEWGFLASLHARGSTVLSEKQEKVLGDIEQKVFGDDD